MANIEWLEAPSDAELAPLASVLSGFWRVVIAGEPDLAPAELATEVRELPSHRRVALAVASERANPVGVAELVGDSVEGRQRLAWLRYLVVVAGRRQRGLGRASSTRPSPDAGPKGEAGSRAPFPWTTPRAWRSLKRPVPPLAFSPSRTASVSPSLTAGCSEAGSTVSRSAPAATRSSPSTASVPTTGLNPSPA